MKIKILNKVLALIIILLPNMILSQEGFELWGMTFRGGKSDIGTIFKTDENAENLELQYDFFKTDGVEIKSGVIEASNGKFYGLAPYSGHYLSGLYYDSDNASGVLYEYDPVTNVYETKFKFGVDEFGASYSANGHRPEGSLIEVNNKLYGMTREGGIHGDGVIFEYDYMQDVFTKIHDFNDSNGRAPEGELTYASNGKLYGMTSVGGDYGNGVIFEFDINTNTYTKKIDFDDDVLNPGAIPYGSLFEASDAKLYGLTSGGGDYGFGVLFQYDFITNALTSLYNFGSTETSGKYPLGTLIEGPNNSLELFGTTDDGGLNGYGILFKYNITTSTFTTLVDFGDANNLGYVPSSNLTLASNNKLYGVTRYGGASDIGSLFEYDPMSNISSVLYGFNYTSGHYPYGSLLEASDGKLYGITNKTVYGNVDTTNGMFYSFDVTTNSYNPIFKFNSSEDGGGPDGSLIFSGNQQKFYGLTYRGGINDTGAIFEFNPVNNLYTRLYSFDEVNNNELGIAPRASLLEASNGKLYGTAYRGGNNNLGVFFEFDLSSNTYSKKHNFSDELGGTPLGDLLQASNNKIYGMTSVGGEGVFMEIDAPAGTIFEYDINTDQYTKIHDFNLESGAFPNGGLIEALNGKLYGMTSDGGLQGGGVVFEYDFTTGFNKLHEFEYDGVNGSRPYGNLLQFDTNTLYGMTSEGGANGDGVIFKFDIQTNTFTKVFDFNDTLTGANPLGSLTLLNNKLYGVTSEGGTYNLGTVFEFNPQNLTFTKTVDFNSQNGRLPVTTSLVVLNRNKLSTNNFEENKFVVYLNPVSETLHISTANMLRNTIIYDLFGKKLYTSEQNRNQIDVSAYQAGIYVLKVETNRGDFTQKIIIN
ncbi:T9SS type A sorting domain-containing protein [Winogradskyella echinorum]|uniref:T9SS type A sorting domain-containing protein n=1 Tax=Winogradskyella echinorum TaxID=538189 RepID=A0ABR6Y303_9FLAO|nr:choice-of-anchor tandem repeat GloVer-containing protein [Winogradskyella echinorum]MBC3846635.1 T9SS type A sorting domain-containing protein [Winogradskyella echinorum]MBC5750983.1 T9SS type A sorting domain-containing protein [Winogradskyella echinorum]